MESDSDPHDIPANVAYTRTLTRPPDLEEMGVPKPFSWLLFVEGHVKHGQWVQRGAPLMTYRGEFFKVERPMFSALFGTTARGGETIKWDATIRASVAGLVVDIRQVMCRSATMSVRGLAYGTFGSKWALPALLVPEDEPPPDYSICHMDAVYIMNGIQDTWRRDVHNTGNIAGGYHRMRFGVAVDAREVWRTTSEELERAIEWAEAGRWEPQTEWLQCDYDHYDSSLDTTIQNLRSESLILRDKLVHLVKRPTIPNAHVVGDPGAHQSWDVFLSYASEDKDFARRLATELRAAGLRVWFDEFEIEIGDSLRRSLDRGLADARFGIVLVSRHWLAKEWPKKELDALISREAHGVKVILPIWHGVDAEFVSSFSPMLADRVAAQSHSGMEDVVRSVLRAVS